MKNSFMRVDEVANELKVSKSYAYKLVKTLNKELSEKGYVTIAGRINKNFFFERVCYGQSKDNERNGINGCL